MNKYDEMTNIAKDLRGASKEKYEDLIEKFKERERLLLELGKSLRFEDLKKKYGDDIKSGTYNKEINGKKYLIEFICKKDFKLSVYLGEYVLRKHLNMNMSEFEKNNGKITSLQEEKLKDFHVVSVIEVNE